MLRNVDATRLLIALLCICLAGSAFAADWPNWRGPNYDGISPEKGFRTNWEKPPPKLWEAEIGSAFSSFSCVKGKAYTCGTKDKQQMLFCFDAATGNVLWRTPIEKEYVERQGGDGTRATPTVNDGRVYIFGALGKMLCCDADTGQILWSQQFKAKPQWGYAASVLIEGDLAIVQAGGDDGLLALDKKSGKPVWKSGKALAGYATPYPFTFDGERYVAGLLGKEAIVVEMKTGRHVFSIPWKTDWDVNAATPLFHDGLLFFSSGYNHGSVVLKLGRDGDKLSGQKVWENKSIVGKFQTPVLYEGYLYVSDESGKLKCVEFATGKEKWKQPGIENGTVVLADGYLVVFTDGGELQIAKASPEKYEPSTKVPLLSGRCWTIPTLYDGRIYVRNLERAACYKLTGE